MDNLIINTTLWYWYQQIFKLKGGKSNRIVPFVGQVALHRITNPDVDKRLKVLIFRLESLQDECVGLMDRDVKEYEKIIRAIQMPKKTRSAQTSREKALQEAKIRAGAPPMMLMEYGLEGLKIGFILIQEGPKVTVADEAVAMEVACSCLRGGIWLTEANLAGITDIEYVKQKIEVLEDLKTEAEDLYVEAKEELKKRF